MVLEPGYQPDQSWPGLSVLWVPWDSWPFEAIFAVADRLGWQSRRWLKMQQLAGQSPQPAYQMAASTTLEYAWCIHQWHSIGNYWSAGPCLTCEFRRYLFTINFIARPYISVSVHHQPVCSISRQKSGRLEQSASLARCSPSSSSSWAIALFWTSSGTTWAVATWTACHRPWTSWSPVQFDWELVRCHRNCRVHRKIGDQFSTIPCRAVSKGAVSLGREGSRRRSSTPPCYPKAALLYDHSHDHPWPNQTAISLEMLPSPIFPVLSGPSFSSDHYSFSGMAELAGRHLDRWRGAQVALIQYWIPSTRATGTWICSLTSWSQFASRLAHLDLAAPLTALSSLLWLIRSADICT